MDYNQKDVDSIVRHGKKLVNQSLRDIYEYNEESKVEDRKDNYADKGSFGALVEELHFGIHRNSDTSPDFQHVGLELKSSPVKVIYTGKPKESIVSKERLVLSIIDFNNIAAEEFSKSSFFKKNRHLLLVFYLYETDKSVWDYIVKLVDEWQIPEDDLIVIRKDWEFIKARVKAGKAHELSEGDTNYLGACTKGASAKTTREQPYSEIYAKQRAYSFKQGYVNHILALLTNKKKVKYGRLFKSLKELRLQSVEEKVIEYLQPFYGMSLTEIEEKINVHPNRKSKSYYHKLAMAMISGGKADEVEELQKSGIIVKTVRIEDNDTIEQSLSFPAFKFKDLYKQEWHESDLRDYLESKFLFLFMKKKGGEYFFEKACVWNMPYKDRCEMEKVYEKTRDVIVSGRIVKEIQTLKNGKKKKLNNFPKTIENYVGHVRPHGRNADDTYPLPVRDDLTETDEFTKQCFWLNRKYVLQEIYFKGCS